MPIKDFDDILNNKDYLPNSKLTAAQINEGWIEITGKEQLKELAPGVHDMLNEYGEDFQIIKTTPRSNWFGEYGHLDADKILSTFIAYRPLPSYEEYEMLKKKCESGSRMLRAWQHKTLRDEMAMAAAPAIALTLHPGERFMTDEQYAESAYKLADAMLKARGEE